MKPRKADGFTDHFGRLFGAPGRFNGTVTGDVLAAQHERNQLPTPAPQTTALYYKSQGRRYCETCKRYMPCNVKKTNKGWKCSECKK